MMGQSWLPDPPDGHRLTSNSTLEELVPTIFVDELDDEDSPVLVEPIIVENGGYHLLDDTDNNESWHSPSSDDEDDEQETIDDEKNTYIEYVESTNNDISSASNQEKYNENQTEQRDITIDPQQIQAAMVNITLPESATPSWAAEIPDSDWGLFLRDRISILQQSNSNK